MCYAHKTPPNLMGEVCLWVGGVGVGVGVMQRLQKCISNVPNHTHDPVMHNVGNGVQFSQCDLAFVVLLVMCQTFCNVDM